MFRRILVPLDGSQRSAKALPYATALARQFKADLVLLRVVTPSMLPLSPAEGTVAPTAAMIEAVEQQDRSNIAGAARYLERRLAALKASGITASREVAMGKPAASILAYCKEHKVDLVVMTTRGRSGLRRALLGSVADEIVRASHVPVLVIRS